MDPQGLTGIRLWAQICAHLNLELRKCLITFPIFDPSQRLIARNVCELFSFNRGVSHLNNACRIDDVSRWSLSTSQRSSTAYFAGTKHISRHEGILQGLHRNWQLKIQHLSPWPESGFSPTIQMWYADPRVSPTHQIEGREGFKCQQHCKVCKADSH